MNKPAQSRYLFQFREDSEAPVEEEADITSDNAVLISILQTLQNIRRILESLVYIHVNKT